MGKKKNRFCRESSDGGRMNDNPRIVSENGQSVYKLCDTENAHDRPSIAHGRKYRFVDFALGNLPPVDQRNNVVRRGRRILVFSDTLVRKSMRVLLLPATRSVVLSKKKIKN